MGATFAQVIHSRQERLRLMGNVTTSLALCMGDSGIR